MNLNICEVNYGKNRGVAVEKLQLGKNQTQSNCKSSCCQCLPKVFQQEAPLAAGETQSKVLLAGSRLGTLAVARGCRRSSEGGPDVKVIEGRPRRQSYQHRDCVLHRD